MTKTVTTGKATDLITFTRSTTGTYLGSDGLLKTANTNEPRIEYDADGNLKGLLIEEQRTNQIRYSNSLSGSAWSGTNCTITTDSTTSPDGNINASKLTCSGGSASVWQFPIPSGLSGNYSNSIYLKADTLNYAQLNVGYLTTNFVANFDLVNGTVTHILGTGATITDVGNGWYLCTLPFNTLGSGGFSVTPIDSMSSTRRSGAVGSVFVYGAQLESGSFPTSYIPTSGSTVTRTSEQASLNASLFEYNGNEGTTVIEFDKANWAYTTTFPRAYSWGHGSQSVDILNDVYNYGNSPPNSGKIRFRVDDSSGNAVFGANFINGSENDNTAKVAIALKDNYMSIAWKGTVVFTDTTGNPAIDLVTKLHIGSKFIETTSVVNDYINGHIKSIKYYPVRLTNNQLKALTQ